MKIFGPKKYVGMKRSTQQGPYEFYSSAVVLWYHTFTTGDYYEHVTYLKHKKVEISAKKI
jgi:hypothetical protein